MTPRGRVLPIAGDAWRFVIPLTTLGVLLIWWGAWWAISLGVVVLLLAAFCLLFFRDFDRTTPMDARAIYAPGDGKVLDVSRLEGGEHNGWWIIRIFLSVLDVHVQRSPVSGKVLSVVHKEGLFLDARDLRAHLDNEQNAVTIQTDRGAIVVKQIAGLIARRIVCWTKPGDMLAAGERYGLIRFGSQVDIVMPPDVAASVKVGDRTVSGETVIGRWAS